MALQKQATTSDTNNEAAIPRREQVRNVTKLSERRINNDWQYLNEKPLSAHASNDEIFNNSYKQQGLSGKIETPNKNSNTLSKAANDETYTPSRVQSRNSTPSQKIKFAAKKHNKALLLLAKTKASAINTSIMAWGGGLWLTTQLPLALISLVMLGVAGTVAGAAQSSGILGWATTAASKLVAGAAAIVGIDADLVSISTSFFTVTYLLVLAIGILCILAAFLQYTLALLNPLSGDMSGLKKGTLLIVLFGYSTPLLNLFPWILLWMAVVWRYPK